MHWFKNNKFIAKRHSNEKLHSQTNASPKLDLTNTDARKRRSRLSSVLSSNEEAKAFLFELKQHQHQRDSREEGDHACEQHHLNREFDGEYEQVHGWYCHYTWEVSYWNHW